MSYKNYRNLRAVCHAFANNESLNGQSSNIFFYDKKAYSYGHHYCLAEKFNNYTVLNDVGYSKSTGKHISYMSSALYGKIYRTTNIVPRVVYNFLSANIEKLKRANKPENYINAIAYKLDQFYNFWEKENFVSSICGYDPNEQKDGISYFELIQSIKDMPELSKSSAKDYLVNLDAKKKALQDIQDQKNKEKHLQSIKDFLNHKCYSVAYRPQNFEEILRISKDWQFIETSAGARVSIKSALLLYKMIQAKRDIKGYQIDFYTVISINGTLKIGCHNIDMKSVHKIGKKLLSIKLLNNENIFPNNPIV